MFFRSNIAQASVPNNTYPCIPPRPIARPHRLHLKNNSAKRKIHFSPKFQKLTLEGIPILLVHVDIHNMLSPRFTPITIHPLQFYSYQSHRTILQFSLTLNTL